MADRATRNGAPAALVDVVVVAAGSGELAMACLDSLETNADRARRVTLVDNEGGAIANAVGQRFEQVDTVVPDGQVGYARACNAGASGGDGELVLFLNDDVVVEDGAVAKLAEAVLGRPQACAAGGRLVDPELGETQAPYKPKGFPTVASLAVQLTGLERLWPGNPISSRRSGEDLDDVSVVPVEQPAGASLLVRRQAFDAIGGFDEGYWFWYEDVDLARRLAKCGEVLYVPEAVFRHLGGVAFTRWSRARQVRMRFHGMLRFAEKHFTRAQRLALAVVIAMVSLPRVVVFGRRRPDVAAAWRAVLAAAAALARGRPLPDLR